MYTYIQHVCMKNWILMCNAFSWYLAGCLSGCLARRLTRVSRITAVYFACPMPYTWYTCAVIEDPAS